MKRRVREAWTDFEASVMPKNAPEVQRVGMRWAFYAGALSLFSTIMTMLEPGQDATEADLANMDDLKKEFDAYQAELQAEAARSRRRN